jgi:hypothetical protein
MCLLCIFFAATHKGEVNAFPEMDVKSIADHKQPEEQEQEQEQEEEADVDDAEEPGADIAPSSPGAAILSDDGNNMLLSGQENSSNGVFDDAKIVAPPSSIARMHKVLGAASVASNEHASEQPSSLSAVSRSGDPIDRAYPKLADLGSLHSLDQKSVVIPTPVLQSQQQTVSDAAVPYSTIDPQVQHMVKAISMNMNRSLESDRVCSVTLEQHAQALRNFTGWFEEKSVQLDGEFFRLVNVYRDSVLQGRNSAAHTKSQLAQCEKSLHLLWTIESKTVSREMKCGDGNMVTQTLDYKVSKYQANRAVELQHQLGELRKAAIDQATLCAYTTLYNHLCVESFLHDFIQEHDLDSNGPGNDGGDGGGGGGGGGAAAVEEATAQLRYFVDVLFHFEKQEQSFEEPAPPNFIESVRKWLKIAVSYLYRVGGFTDHQYVFLHVVRCRGISQWGHFVQFPQQLLWTAELRGHFLQMLMIFLSPLQNRHFNPKLSHVDGDDPDWVAVDKAASLVSDEDSDVSLRLMLNESDFSWTLQQFPMWSFLKSLFHDVMSAGDLRLDQLSHAFGIAKATLALISNGLYALVEYAQFSKLAARTLVWIAWIIIEVYSQSQTNSMPAPQAVKDLFQRELDWITVRSLAIIHEAPQPGVDLFLLDFPFMYISPGAAAESFRVLFVGAPAAEYSDSGHTFESISLEQWHEMVQSDSKLRQHFVHTMRESRDYSFVLLALAKLARDHGGELPSIIMHELFYAAYLSRSTRDKVVPQCHELFSAICAVHPSLISELLNLTIASFDTLGDAGLALFDVIDLDVWHPTQRDLEQLRWLLTASSDTLQAQLGCYLLDHLNYSFVVPGLEHSDSALRDNSSWMDQAGMSDHKRSASIVPGASGAYQGIPETSDEAAYLRHRRAVSQVTVSNPSKPTLLDPVLGWVMHRDILVMLAAARAHNLVKHSSSAFLFGTKFKLNEPAWWVHILEKLHTHNMKGNMMVDTMKPGDSFYHEILQICHVKADNDSQFAMLKADPVLMFVELSVTESAKTLQNFMRTGWNDLRTLLTSQHYRSLGFRLLGVLLPDLVLESTRSSAVIGVPIVRSVLDSERGGLFSFLSKQTHTYDGAVQLHQVMVAHMLNSVAFDLLASIGEQRVHELDNIVVNTSDMMYFWLTEIAAGVPSSWVRDHNCRYLADSLICSMIIIPPVSATDHLDVMLRFLHDQSLGEQKHQQDTGKYPSMGSKRIGNGKLVPLASLLSQLDTEHTAQQHPWLAFGCLLHDSRADLKNWRQLGQDILRHPLKMPAKKVIKRMGYGKEVLWECIIRRWGRYAVAMNPDHQACPLFWQGFFFFYFSRITGLQDYGAGNESGYYGYRLLEGNTGGDLMRAIRQRLEFLLRHSEQRMQQSMQEPDEHKDEYRLTKYKRWQQLFELYRAMNLWIHNKDPVSVWMTKIERFPSNYQPIRLVGLITEDFCSPTRQHMWFDLIDRDSIADQVREDTKMYFSGHFFNFVFGNPKQRREAGPSLMRYRSQLSSSQSINKYSPVDPGAAGVYSNEDSKSYSKTPFSLGPGFDNSSSDLHQSSDTDFDSKLVPGAPVDSVYPSIDQEPGRTADVSVMSSSPDSVQRKLITNGLVLVDSGLSGQAAYLKVAKGSIWDPPLPVDAGCLLDVPNVLQAPVWASVSESKEFVSRMDASLLMFSQRLGEAETLDQKLLELAPQLWRNEQKESKFDRYCHRAGHCRGAAVFVFRHPDAVMVQHVMAQMRENRQVSLTCHASPDISREFCAAMLRIRRIVDYMTSQVASQDPASDEKSRIHASGFQWLQALAGFESQLTQRYPPTRHFLSECVAALQGFVSTRLIDLRQVVSMMINHPHLIPALIGAIPPASVIDKANPGFNAFSTLFAQIVYVNDATGCTSLDVLERFSMTDWLTGMPPKKQWEDVFEVCWRNLQAIHAKPGITSAHLLTYFNTAIQQLVEHQFPDNFLSLFTRLLDSAHLQSVPASLWDNVAALPLHKLTYAQLVDMWEYIANYLWALRVELPLQVGDVNPSLFSVLPDVVGPLLAFTKRTFSVAVSTYVTENASNAQKQALWDSMWQVFAPWLAPTIPLDRLDPSQCEIIRPHCMYPWQSNESKAARIALHTFVSVIKLLLPIDPSMLARVWSLYARQLAPDSVLNVLSLYNDALFEIHFDNWRLGNETLWDMFFLLQNTNGPASAPKRSLLASVICRVLVEGDWLHLLTSRPSIDHDPAAISDDAFPAYGNHACALLCVVVSLLGDLPRPLDGRFQSLCHVLLQFDWQHVSLQHYTDCLQRLSSILYSQPWMDELNHERGIPASAEGGGSRTFVAKASTTDGFDYKHAFGATGSETNSTSTDYGDATNAVASSDSSDAKLNSDVAGNNGIHYPSPAAQRRRSTALPAMDLYQLSDDKHTIHAVKQQPLRSPTECRAFILLLMFQVSRPHENIFNNELLVQCAKKMRMFAEWLLSVFQGGQQGDKTLCSPAVYGGIARVLLSTLDRYGSRIVQLTGEQLIIETMYEYIGVINAARNGVATPDALEAAYWSMCRDCPNLSLIAMTAVTQQMLSLRMLARSLEYCITSALRTTRSWDAIVHRISIPEVDTSGFYKSCIDFGCIHTLHSCTLLRLGRTHNSIEQQLCVDQLAEWVENSKMSELGSEIRLLYAWRTIVETHLNSVTSQSQSDNEHATSASLTKLVKHIKSCSEDAKFGALLGFVGIGSSTYSPLFRLGARILAAFLLLRRGAHVKKAKVYSFDWDGKMDVIPQELKSVHSHPKTHEAKDKKKVLESLDSILSNKKYKEVWNRIPDLIQLVKSEHLALRDFSRFFAQFFVLLFNGTEPYPIEWQDTAGPAAASVESGAGAAGPSSYQAL